VSAGLVAVAVAVNTLAEAQALAVLLAEPELTQQRTLVEVAAVVEHSFLHTVILRGLAGRGLLFCVI
jgi:hypothetical protein